MYSVYSLTDGITDNENIFDNFDDAFEYWEAVVGMELILKNDSEEYAETTVHLFDAHDASMNLLAEYCITAK
jgi:hypothetical protein